MEFWRKAYKINTKIITLHNTIAQWDSSYRLCFSVEVRDFNPPLVNEVSMTTSKNVLSDGMRIKKNYITIKRSSFMTV